jgi:hypothetical protein
MAMLFFKRNPLPKITIILIVLLLVFGCHKLDPRVPVASDESADVVYQWYKFISKTQLVTAPPPVTLFNYRAFGYIGVGLYESVRPGIRGGLSLSTKLYQMPHMPDAEYGQTYYWSGAANAALASMFKQFLSGLTEANKASIDSLENANNNRFKLSISDAVLTRSQAYGRAIATAIYNWSTTDNFNLSSAGYQLPVFPGAYELTPPAFSSPVGPFLKDSRPFLTYTLTSGAPPPPVPYSEDPSSDFYKQAKEVYDIGKNLTAEEKLIADWWANVGGPGVGLASAHHDLGIITGLLEKKAAKLAQAAVIYAKTGIAMKDAPITVWRTKFQYNLLRPITYIRKHIDANWSSYLITPPYPDYLSGLVGIYAPEIQVLIREFGDIPVTDDSYTWRGAAPRQFSSLSKMVEEAGQSRVYGGIHYSFTQIATIEKGKEIGNLIADINLISGTK